MGKLTADIFADWLPPNDVVNHFYQQGMGDDEALARTVAMLEDGLLQAAAEQLVVNGRDLGLAVLPRELWIAAARTEVWSTGRFRLSGVRDEPWSISAYGVRIDRDIRAAPTTAPKPAQPPANRPALPDALLVQWGSVFRAANPSASEDEARRAVEASFPTHYVSRERLRRIMPPRRRGRPLKNRD